MSEQTLRKHSIQGHVTYSLHWEDVSTMSGGLETLTPLPFVLAFIISQPKMPEDTTGTHNILLTWGTAYKFWHTRFSQNDPTKNKYNWFLKLGYRHFSYSPGDTERKGKGKAGTLAVSTPKLGSLTLDLRVCLCLCLSCLPCLTPQPCACVR